MRTIFTVDEKWCLYTNIKHSPPWVDKDEQHKPQPKVAPKYKLSTCVVQKSMSTVMTAIFCYLFDEDGFQQAGRELLKETKRTRFCENRNEARSMRSLRWHFGIRKEDDWIHTMVTRDPVDRFLFGFVDKCIKCVFPVTVYQRMPLPGEYCNGCKANMTCFIIKEYERMVSEVKKDRFTRTFEDRHFFPQNWFVYAFVLLRRKVGDGYLSGDASFPSTWNTAGLFATHLMRRVLY
ncbi:hypothetical protein Y032_0440g1508 [Ancylostoma ceylanicum]|uniref:Sulfotransferase domain-containing protein n=2 Tax=Ancylostoma ceylanicum TaxID=53326 RepID=A0A016X0P6_9BILA|nr:hypothetical protein Y032_0440g1508 [Ancylostoma ceylanicum]